MAYNLRAHRRGLEHTVMPRKILCRISRRNPCGARDRSLKTRYNKSAQNTPKHQPEAKFGIIFNRDFIVELIENMHYSFSAATYI